ncbi:MAG: kinase/pyrophosphorylase [Candidatus Accumulibacter phosphatis]|uniref:Kinase/pyrophosphorylase n=2 Tax=Candidatus Accumulibacter TaxID=327159 RepID=A0A080M4P1_9PROT|nr:MULTISPECIES: pyruvate, water dikinase regulatory protein [Candidatus Accumulibacter]KFB76021.1 MAG: putative pyruvate, phosphate dikinase regulatory protein [Candidatus Accumulibacter cognatus]MBL8400699.1 kinase/pyrophosphorylase [Accumulibacter sp.]MCC2869117.1 kinase/pyrophosphorylase [Candidatus Accumulibacter phosphatis]MCM8580080.1 kinase/pyrophosphorylase [Accumulibacter sp.]MCM8620423.1 kinase/pyrophosphorylase [Accumulibacter sp.]
MMKEKGRKAEHSRTIVLYLVSHASGELVEMLARNAVTQLTGLEVKRRLWKMVRHLDQVPEILGTFASSPGYVLHSISHHDIREALEEGCRRLNLPYQFALEPLLGRLAGYSGATVQFHNSSGDAFDEDYYRRVEAMKYTLAHDDGIGSDDLEGADVIVVGVSRATKTPTCMYLASRGIKAANVPLVPGAPPPLALLHVRKPLIVGLTVDPVRLAMVRAARLTALQDDTNTDYADIDGLRKEVLEARRLFIRRGWPIIDATHRSIEQTASMIVEMLRKRAIEGH